MRNAASGRPPWRQASEALEHPRYQAVRVGLLVHDLSRKEDILACDPDGLFVPASTIKIVVAGAALSLLGPEHRTRTLIASQDHPRDGVLSGDLYLVGRGDPGLATEALNEAARKLASSGLRRIDGRVRYDQSYFDAEAPRYGSLARDLFAPPCALSLDFNRIPLLLEAGPPPSLRPLHPSSYVHLEHSISLEPGSRPSQPSMTFSHREGGERYVVSGVVTDWTVAINYLGLGAARPGLYAATVLTERLIAAGVTVEGAPSQGLMSEEAVVLRTISSRPMSELVERMLRESDNVVAETIGKLLGASFEEPQGTRAKGLTVLRRHAEKSLGWPADGFTLADASGLARENRFSSRLLVQALARYRADPPVGSVLLGALPRQGVDRLVRNPEPPRGWEVRVKTGTLSASGVNAIAGYLSHAESGRELAFAIFANRESPGPAT